MLLLVAFAFTAAAQGPGSHRILYINSYHPGYEWADAIYAGLRQGLTEAFGDNADLRVEYLDGKRFSAALDGRLGELTLAKWAEEYGGHPPDLLLTSDQDAYNLARRARRGVFRGVPLLFVGAENPDPIEPGTAGITSSTDIAANLEAIRGLMPQAKRLWLVTDNSTTGRINRDKAIRLAAAMNPPLRLEFFDRGDGIEPSELIAQAIRPVPGDAALFLDFFSSPSGKVNTLDVLRAFTGAARVPVFACVETYLPCGVVGGVMTSGEALGRQLAGMAATLLKGGALPATQAQQAHPVYDYRLLERFSLPMGRLPRESAIRNAPESALGHAWKPLLAGGAIVLIEALLIGTLFALLARQRRLRAQSARASEHFRLLFRQAPIPMALMGREGRTLDMNDTAIKVMGYTPQDVPTLDVWWQLAYPDPAYRAAVSAGWLTAADRALATGQPIEHQEYTVRLKDGRDHPMLIGASVLGDILVVSFIDVSSLKMAEETLRLGAQRAQAQRTAIAQLALGLGAESAGLEPDLDRLTRLLASTMGVARASVWRLTGSPRRLECLSLYDAALKAHSRGASLDPSTFPAYFETLLAENRISAEDTLTDPRMAGLAESYFRPLGIGALLDTAVILEGALVGVVSCEHAGRGRLWQTDEESFCGTIASMVAQLFANDQRRAAEAARRELEEQLTQAQKMESVGRLAGGVAHDFNNMLGVILGRTELALAQEGLPGDLRAGLEEIHTAAERSADLTRQLLAFARKQTVAPKVLDLNATVSGMMKMLRRLIGEEIRLTWTPAPALWPVKIDPSQVDQMLANLCVNARDAIAGVGDIGIATACRSLDEAFCAQRPGLCPGDYAVLTVTDNGAGMDPQTLRRAFEPFFTTKATGKGTGLGLATVYGIVVQNRGYVDVESAPGRGTTFTVYLPRHAAPPDAEVQTQAPGVQGGREAVLLVEDEKAVRAMALTMLQSLGYRVVAAETPEEALRAADQPESEIDLLVTDIIMPAMNGRDLARALLKRRPRLKCLFMSGYSADLMAHHGVLDEGVHFIQKPFSLQGLAAKVREALEAP